MKTIKAVIAFCAMLSATATFAAEKQITLRIEEMNCQLCVYLVNKELRAVEGVITTKANFNDRLVRITADESVTVESLIKAINKLHYHAEVQN